MKENNDDVLTYGFFLRFAKKNYIPCKKCQGRLHGLLMQNKWDISSVISVGFNYLPDNKHTCIIFNMFFLPSKPVAISSVSSKIVNRWAPCDTCQKYLLDIVRKSEFILGNKDYTDPPIELWRKWMPKE